MVEVRDTSRLFLGNPESIGGILYCKLKSSHEMGNEENMVGDFIKIDIISAHLEFE